MNDRAKVLVVQTVIREAADGPLFQQAVDENLYRSMALIEKSVRRNGAPNIVVLPEFFLTGLSSTRTFEQCLAMARRVPGPETAALGELAREYGIYIAGATWEFDPEWPDRWFNTAFIVGPSGDVELRYRKINEGNYQLGLTDSTPGDLYDAYVARYGEAALWPVLDTPYGKLACIICFDLNFAETTRMMVLRGAEVILNPTGEPHGSHRGIWELSRRTRAFENVAYWVSANHGGYTPTLAGERFVDDRSGAPLFAARVPGGITATSRSHGGSEVVDYRGIVVAKVDGIGEATVEADLDLGALRRARADWVDAVPGAGALVGGAGRTLSLGYEQAVGFPLNELLDDPLTAQPDGPRHLRRVLESLRGAPVLGGTGPVEPAVVLALQADVAFVGAGTPEAEVVGTAKAMIDRAEELLEAELVRTGASLVVLPHGWPVSFLAGPDAGSEGQGVEPGGPELVAVSELAARQGVYVGGSVLQRSERPGGAPYRLAYLFDPEGNVVLHRRALFGATRGYEPIAGPAGWGGSLDDSFPVVATPFGNVAMAIGREVASLELMRLLAYRGAEIVLNPTAEYEASLAEGLAHARRVRASENVLYLVTAGQGALLGRVPAGASRAGSAIVDYEGSEVTTLGEGRTAGLDARLDVPTLRQRRSTGGMNKLVQLRPRLYAPSYRARPRLVGDEPAAALADAHAAP